MILRTERLLIRPFKESDINDLYDIYTIDNAAMIQEIREKGKKAGEGGYTYQQIK